MDLTYPPAAEAFRTSVRDWLADALPAGWCEGSRPSGDAYVRFAVEWNEMLHAEGWATPTWPTKYGGRGLDQLEAIVLAEELADAGAPIQPPAGGEILVGPTILHLGSEEQKDRHLVDIARGRSVWCQGFSEPDSGSDLASLQTTATLDGEDLVIHGHKIWTSQAQDADFCFALCRTGSEPRHAGISYLLIPMDQAGVEVRTIAQPDGTAGFAEVLFDGARCSLDDVVDGLGNGWKVAMSTLAFERGTSATSSWQRYARDLDAVVQQAKALGTAQDPVLRQRFAHMWTRIQLMRIDGMRVLTSVLDPALAHTTAALEAGTKVRWTEFHRDLTELAVDVLGPRGTVMEASGEKAVGVGLGHRSEVHHYPAGPVHQAFLFARSGTIFGGTSEIQRNIIGERVLGLPREPR